ncbi:metallopeptidase domain-containing protein [Rhizobium phage RHph_TM3_14A]|nr:metallopeptidase domain-containing protein [Rhizobium phage RHph_TM27A]QIG66975.1 metallopeptidase domain-containing protein [Rhizobium phage RHph_TM27B]QIG67064.1 metallopeptidase domain-containing protein [Rhizobium phage RHph_TM29]QIG67520.1 metallopeptidase domain-containing protein [Rhizobium phage RHph_TM3_14A]
MTMPQTVEITPEQMKKWADTRAAMVWHAPAFTHLLYSMMNKNGNEHVAYFVADVPPEDPNHVPVAATDGSHLLINPKTFFEYNLMERVFVVAHEVVHGMCGHAELMQRLGTAGKVSYPDGKSLDYDAGTLNRAMDYVVNDLLVESKIGTYNTNWLHDKVIGTHMDDVLTVYRRIYQQEKKNGGGSATKQGQKGFDKHMQPGTTTGQDPAQAAAGRNEVAWGTAIAGALSAAKAQGKLPAALERLLGDTLEPKVSWQDKIMAFFARKVGGGSYDWRKPDRRFIVRNIVAPARSGFGCGDIVVAGDSSGSITDDISSMFFGEVGGILEELRPRRLFFMWCDAKVHNVDELNDGADLYHLKKKGALGGGGTDFRPVFDKVAELGIEPDALIYLTDGYGSFPQQAPNYQVLWGSISKDVKYPFGDVVEIPV